MKKGRDHRCSSRGRSTLGLVLAFLALLARPAPARAQEVPPASLMERIGDAARRRLGDPSLLDRVGEHRQAGRIERLLEDLHFSFEVFERDPDGELALGFSYDVAKTLRVPDESVRKSLDFVASGNVAFEQSSNPDDLQTGLFRLRWWGTRTLGDSAPSRLDLAENLHDPELEELAALDSRRTTDLAVRTMEEDLEADPDFRSLLDGFVARIEPDLPPEVVWDFDLHAGLESNQDLSSRQWVAGPSIGGRLISWDPEAKLSRFNVFDFPAAALRWLAGQEGFDPSGRAYPTAVVGFDVVDASRVAARRDLTDFDSFLRTRVELGLESRVLDLEGEPLFLSLAWRYYQEIDAPGAVRDADMDDASQLEVGLDLPRGWTLTYRTGRLPLDRSDDSTFVLGFELRL